MFEGMRKRQTAAEPETVVIADCNNIDENIFAKMDDDMESIMRIIDDQKTKES